MWIYHPRFLFLLSSGRCLFHLRIYWKWCEGLKMLNKTEKPTLKDGSDVKCHLLLIWPFFGPPCGIAPRLLVSTPFIVICFPLLYHTVGWNIYSWNKLEVASKFQKWDSAVVCSLLSLGGPGQYLIQSRWPLYSFERCSDKRDYKGSHRRYQKKKKLISGVCKEVMSHRTMWHGYCDSQGKKSGGKSTLGHWKKKNTAREPLRKL